MNGSDVLALSRPLTLGRPSVLRLHFFPCLVEPLANHPPRPQGLQVKSPQRTQTLNTAEASFSFPFCNFGSKKSAKTANNKRRTTRHVLTSRFQDRCTEYVACYPDQLTSELLPPWSHAAATQASVHLQS